MTASPTGRAAGKPARRRVSARGEGAALRDEIIEAAIGLVEELDDPWSLSLRAVARRVGVAATSIYLHFDSLDALLLATKTELWRRFGERMERATERAAATTAYEKIRAFGDAYVQFARENPGAYRTLFETSWDLQTPEGEGFVGEARFQSIVDVMLTVTDDSDEAKMRAVQLWCSIHGLVSLRIPMQSFPWPDISDQLDDLARRLTTP